MSTRQRRSSPWFLVVAALASACGGTQASGADGTPVNGLPATGFEEAGTGGSGQGGGTGTTVTPATPSPLLTDRPYALRLPSGYDASRPHPLVLLLHGYTATAPIQAIYLDLYDLADEHGFVLALPNGTVDKTGMHFWNATDACCDLYGAGPDDVAYLTAVLDDAVVQANVDPKRVFAIGHSNGAYMANRLACDRASRIAAFVSLAGAQWADPARCTPTEPVSMLEIHGTLDTLVQYNGGTTLAPYPSAKQTVATWAAKNGCTGALGDTGVRRDFAGTALWSETEIDRYGGCPQGGAVELWTMNGVGHMPVFTGEARESIWGFLASHPRP